MRELIVDNFAGGGGASTGIEAALGEAIALAVNHDGAALAMHEANHPETRHLCGDVFDVDPLEATKGQPVGLAWFSPDCTHFSKAKSGKPIRDKKIRGLAWVVIRWAKVVKPRLIMLENVEEFEQWGPLLDDGSPCPKRKGLTFRRWWRELERAGYQVEMRILRACDYGAPTSRKRLFVVARCDGRPIVWPEPTHGPGRIPYRTAAECIDWSIPCPSIFDRKRPLAEATMRRIARGIFKYVIGNSEPFIVDGNAQSMIQTGYGERKGQAPRALDLEAPLGTIVGGGCKHALVTAFLAKHYGGNETPGTPLDRVMDTVTAKDHHALVGCGLERLEDAGHRAERVRAFLLKYYGTDQDPRLNEPLHTITSHDRFALVTVNGEDYAITDIGMRMLTPRELYNAQGFPADYVIDPIFRGRHLTKTQQVRLCGNSVPPPLAEALTRANMIENQMEAIA